jgi:hypothetical protein
MKRVVTGRDSNGRSVLVEDGPVAATPRPSGPGNGPIQVWGNDRTPTLPSDGAQPQYVGFFPPAGGYRVIISEIMPEPPPDDPADDSADTAAGRVPEHRLGMHTTDTVDIGVILDGELEMELDDGVTTTLSRGDCIVQNGTQHAWHNRTDRVCTAVFFIVGAQV